MTAPHRPTAADEVHFPRTADGWHVALHRHHPRHGGDGLPVIVCGGYACNRHFVDYDERYSLARFLARAGFDAWVLELRGRGLSYPGAGCVQPSSWTFDDLVDFDVPTAVRHVAGATGRDVAWVGHSMGGMVLYAYLGSEAAAPVSAGVTIASPLVFPRAASELLTRIGRVLLSLPFTDVIPQRWVLTGLWSVLGHSAAAAVGMNPDNVDRALIGDALRRFMSDVPRAKLQQLAHWAVDGVFCSTDGRVDYRAGLRHVTTPLLVVAGSADRLATPAAVREALQRLVAAPAAYLEFGRAHGHRADYGHVDLILGHAAPEEVFPAVAGWLAAQVAPAAAAGTIAAQ
jgi:predicted alpha/beta hydrolase